MMFTHGLVLGNLLKDDMFMTHDDLNSQPTSFGFTKAKKQNKIRLNFWRDTLLHFSFNYRQFHLDAYPSPCVLTIDGLHSKDQFIIHITPPTPPPSTHSGQAAIILHAHPGCLQILYSSLLDELPFIRESSSKTYDSGRHNITLLGWNGRLLRGALRYFPSRPKEMQKPGQTHTH